MKKSKIMDNTGKSVSFGVITRFERESLTECTSRDPSSHSTVTTPRQHQVLVSPRRHALVRV